MDLAHLGELTLRYTALESLDYGVGGQLYGTMEGRITGDRLNGRLHLTNLAPRRPDNVNMLELDGIANLRASDAARVFVTGRRFRTGAGAYEWLNSTYAVVEGVLDSVAVGGIARCRIYECRPYRPGPSRPTSR